MDFWNRHRNALALRSLSWRVPELQTTFKEWRERLKTIARSKLKSGAKLDLAKIEKLRTVIFVLISVVMGFWAYQTCCEETSLEWQKRHFPSAAIWKTGLQSEGYQHLQNQKVLSQALKNLPSRLDNGNTVWQSTGTRGQPSWWAVYGASGDSGDPLIFCVRCGEAPRSWEPAGSGWSGFDNVISKAREQVGLYPPEMRPIRAIPKRKEFFDPREIRY